MPTATTRTTEDVMLRPEYIQDIDDDNRHLHTLMTALGALINNRLVLRNHLTRLVTLLNEFRDQLAVHFTLEEAYGYFDDAIDSAPRLAASASRLREEHSELFAMLVAIADEANDASAHQFPAAQVNKIVQLLHDFNAVLNEHEKNELRLAFEALHRDLGGEA